MTLRRKVLLSAIAFFIVIYICQITVSKTGGVKTDKIKNDFDFISCDGNGIEYSLEENDNVWKISGNEMDCEERLIDSMKEKIASVTLLQTVSRNPGENLLEQYGLTEPLTVIAKKDGKTVRKIIVGNPSVTGLQTYIQLNDKNTVYLVQGNLKEIFQKKNEDLIRKNIYTLNEKEIYQVNFISSEENFTLEKKGHDEDLEWVMNGEKELDAEKASTWINLLCQIDASNWILNPENESLTPKATIEVFAADKKITLVINVNASDVEKKYICTSSETKYGFVMNSYKAQMILEHKI